MPSAAPSSLNKITTVLDGLKVQPTRSAMQMCPAGQSPMGWYICFVFGRRRLLLLLFSLFEFAKTKRTELCSDKGANDERHNHYA